MDFAGQPTSRFLNDFLAHVPDVLPTVDIPYVKRPARMVVDVTSNLGLQLLEGLIEAEDPEFGMIHGDLHLGNIFVKTRSTINDIKVSIIDFGYSRVRSSNDQVLWTNLSGLKTGARLRRGCDRRRVRCRCLKELSS